MIPEKFTIKDSISMGWKLSKQYWLFLAGLYLIIILLAIFLDLFLGGFEPPIANQYFYQLLDINGYHQGALEPNISTRRIIAQIISFIISNVFFVGYYKMYLNAVDGIAPELSTFSQSANRIIPALLTSLISMFMILAGVILFILPGFYLLIRLQYATIIAIDKPISPFAALKESWELTKGKFLPLFGQFWIILGIGILGFLCFYVGLFFALVVIIFICIFTYRMLQNEYIEKIKPETDISDQKN